MAKLAELAATARPPRGRLTRLAWLIAVLALGALASGMSAVPASARVAAVDVSMVETQTATMGVGWSLSADEVNSWDGSAAVHGGSTSRVLGEFAYDYRPDLARPPAESVSYVYDTSSNSSHPGGEASRVRRVSSGPAVQGVAPRTAPTGNAYSVAFETQLDDAVLGGSRSVHFNRANAALDDALRADAGFAAQFDELIPGVSSAVSRTGGRATPGGYTWHHVPSSASGGRVV